jgi:hypothetical protein
MADEKPRPASLTQRLLDVVLRETGSAARRAVDRKLARQGYSEKDVRKIVEREGFAKRFAAAAITRLATRSVPGALAVSGAIAARALIGRRKPGETASPAPEVVEDSAE